MARKRKTTAIGAQLRAAADGPLRSATHRVRWHINQADGGYRDDDSGLHYAKGKLVDPKFKKAKAKRNERQNTLV
jgi:hypothetical protein